MTRLPTMSSDGERKLSDESTGEITYPPIQSPATGDGSSVEVAPGVFWLRMPLFISLPWINVWAISGNDGWTIVDTGIQSAKTVEAWESAFSGHLNPSNVVRVLATHMHADHCGMAGWITKRFNTELWMTQTEYLSSRVTEAETGGKAPQEAIDFYHTAGWNAASIESYKEKYGSLGEMMYPLPHSYRRIVDGERIEIGSHEWTVVVGNGHSPEHASLYCADLQLLISGDQVLPGISSNVSVHATETLDDPLRGWLTSLEKIKRIVPDTVLVLPAHRSPFKGLHARLDQLIDGHHDGLRRLLGDLRRPHRIVDTFGSLFHRPITADLLGAATGEALAHLNYLWLSGAITRNVDDHGVAWWLAN
jgi:glyoxylase-like metal-dependent hydrolase (beta-lactamase superfamily II)